MISSQRALAPNRAEGRDDGVRDSNDLTVRVPRRLTSRRELPVIDHV